MGGEIKYIKTNAKLCAGCNRCTLTCSFNKYQIAHPDYSAIRITEDLPQSYKVKIHVCIQCKGEDCLKNCPQGALQRNSEGIIVLENSKCDGCQGDFKCVEACPYGFIFKNPSLKYPIKCDLCGGDPLCVSQCPMSILRV